MMVSVAAPAKSISTIVLTNPAPITARATMVSTRLPALAKQAVMAMPVNSNSTTAADLASSTQLPKTVTAIVPKPAVDQLAPNTRMRRIAMGAHRAT
jgi:hypothetical protein